MHHLPVPSISVWSHVELLVQTESNSAIWFGTPALSFPLWYPKWWHKHIKVSQGDQMFCSPLRRPFPKAMQHMSPKVKYPPDLMQPKVKGMSSKSNYCQVTAEVNRCWGKVLTDAKKRFSSQEERKHVNQFPPILPTTHFFPGIPVRTLGRCPLFKLHKELPTRNDE